MRRPRSLSLVRAFVSRTLGISFGLLPARFLYQLRLGSLDLTEADLAWELLGSFNDPLVESSFQNAYANVLVLSARYDEALAVAACALRDGAALPADFAIPYAQCSAGMADSGLRHWRQARELLEIGTATALKQIETRTLTRVVTRRSFVRSAPRGSGTSSSRAPGP